MEVSPERASSDPGDEDGWDNSRGVNYHYSNGRLQKYETPGSENWGKIIRYLRGMHKSQGFDVEHLGPSPKYVPLVRPMSFWKNQYEAVMLQAAQSAIACFNAKKDKNLLLFEVVKANIRVIYSRHPEFFMTLKTLDRSSLLMETYLAKVLCSTSLDWWKPQPVKDNVKTFKRKKEHDDNDDDDDPFAYEVCRSCCRETHLLQALDRFNSSRRRPTSNSNGKKICVRLGHPYHGCRIRLCIEACVKRLKDEKSDILGFYDVQSSEYLIGPDADPRHLYLIACLGRDVIAREYFVSAEVVFDNKNHAVSEIPVLHQSNPFPSDSFQTCGTSQF
ncbi:hypothetical protein Tsubulata_048710 [Turnera subulata]|uniref:Uncharacterized protein n=1 Tax=Turnera subulata TaxID=218843 RepID=A0A9Q0G250_9ROSI|nr:hypothetical protein Tsubulata_048710 [Turnera subulata]